MVIHRLITIATDALTFYFVFIKNWSVLGVNMREKRLIAMVLTLLIHVSIHFICARKKQ